MKKKLIFIPIIFTFLLVVSASAYTNSLSVSPSSIGVGGKVTITLEINGRATGTLSVTDPDGNTYVATEPVDINYPGGTQTWIYPDDFPGANTNILGDYKVEANIAIADGSRPPVTDFMVNTFFHVPEAGTIVAAISTIGALFGYKFLKKRRMTLN